MKRLSILQVFSRYLQYGGEEGSFFRIGDAMQSRHDLEYFMGSSEELASDGFLRKLMIPFLVFYNARTIRRLQTYQEIGHFDCWQVHNVFPAISPSAYSLAFKLGIPVVHYLHNYKFGCVNGFLFHDGKENRDCLKGNFWPAIRDKTWRNSRVQTAVMAMVLTYARSYVKVFEKVTRWVAISEVQKRIHVEMGIPEDRIDVVPHFLACDPDAPLPPFPEDGYGLFVGRLSPEKGVNRLLEAWALLPTDRKLVIMGDGPESVPLQRLAQTLKLENVVFTGFIPQKEQGIIWEGAAFTIVPSIWQETFGMVVLESWSKGRPVIAHDIGALPEIIRDGIDGFLADRDRVESLAAALQNAFSDREKLVEMGLAGWRRLIEDYNESRWLDRIDAVYRAAGIL
jgi:glycosyltransferase involved in cell wall biosynthesis